MLIPLTQEFLVIVLKKIFFLKSQNTAGQQESKTTDNIPSNQQQCLWSITDALLSLQITFQENNKKKIITLSKYCVQFCAAHFMEHCS